MSEPWKIERGDLVICISDATPFGACARRLAVAGRIKRGRVYRVAAVFPNSEPGLHLVGVDHRPTDGWRASRFRKIEAADAAFISTLAAKRQTRSPHQ
jgi:hypothetical protein